MSLYHFFLFNATSNTQIYTLSLHDALPISSHRQRIAGSDSINLNLLRRTNLIGTANIVPARTSAMATIAAGQRIDLAARRSEEHTSELQSLTNLVCRLLLEKKKRFKIEIQG